MWVEVTRVPARQRLMGWLAEPEQLIDHVDRHCGDIPVELGGGTVVVDAPRVDDPDAGLPEAGYVLGRHELR